MTAVSVSYLLVCIAGYFLPKGSLSGCSPCPKDTYQTRNGSSSCKPCPPGTGTFDSVAASNLSQCSGIELFLSIITEGLFFFSQAVRTSFVAFLVKIYIYKHNRNRVNLVVPSRFLVLSGVANTYERCFIANSSIPGSDYRHHEEDTVRASSHPFFSTDSTGSADSFHQEVSLVSVS